MTFITLALTATQQRYNSFASDVLELKCCQPVPVGRRPIEEEDAVVREAHLPGAAAFAD
jgi:hypothetical protein